jgi:hypothetical protein
MNDFQGLEKEPPPTAISYEMAVLFAIANTIATMSLVR